MPEPIREDLVKMRAAIDQVAIIASLIGVASNATDDDRLEMFNTAVMWAVHKKLTGAADDLMDVLLEIEPLGESAPVGEKNEG